MKEDVKKLWTDALRSGEYRQGRNTLRAKDDTYCCLGVLCAIYQKQRGNGVWQENYGARFYSFIVDGERSSAFLPKSVTKWAGLEDGAPRIPSEGTRLDILNDNGVPFADIANFIEKDL